MLTDTAVTEGVILQTARIDKNFGWSAQSRFTRILHLPSAKKHEENTPARPYEMPKQHATSELRILGHSPKWESNIGNGPPD